MVIKRKLNKKAVFFSIDALIALMIILLSVLVVYPNIKSSKQESVINEDVLDVLSSLKISEMVDSGNIYVSGLVASGDISVEDYNKTVLEKIGEFYVIDLALAQGLSNEILLRLETDESIGIWYGDELLTSKGSVPYGSAKNIDVERRIISGIQEGESVTGFSARAFLTSGLQKKYFYFGGYVGDGNISVNINYTGEMKDINLEIAVNDDFNIYINDIFSGQYENSSSDFHPAEYDLSAYLSNFNSGENTIKFVGIDENLHISGGYVKISYKNSVQYDTLFKYNFPGIEGIVNLYDGFYVPGTLNEMSVYLHYESPYKMFLNIGGINVFNESGVSGIPKTITNAELISKGLDYNFLSRKTIPLRLGLANVSYVSSETRNADVFSVTDLSGSMQETCVDSEFFCCFFSGNFCGSDSTCNSCGGHLESPIDLAKQANNVFINAVLNNSENRVGLVGYRDSVDASDYHSLSNNNDSLISEVNGWIEGGATCICCGINRAMGDLVSNSGSDKFRSMVVMSDGEANRCCSGFNDYTGSSCSTNNAVQDAINSACYAYNTHEIKVYSIGFGADADEDTLEDISDCGNGTYTFASIDDLIEVYEQIAQDILEASYSEQTIKVTGGFENTFLYPDSYISFDYTPDAVPYGLTTTTETNPFGNTLTEGSFLIPDDSEIINANVVSYSGPRWTDNVYIYNETLSDWINVFSLSDYGSDYIKLGDPYVINIPFSYLKTGENQVRISTGVSPTNSTSGSESDKAIYTIVRSVSEYSEIASSANGCFWHIQFEDDTFLDLDIPNNYSTNGGINNCYYQNTSFTWTEDGIDAINSAVYKLMRKLDLDSDGKLDVKFTEQDLDISSSEVTGIPYTYSTEVKVIKWD